MSPIPIFKDNLSDAFESLGYPEGVLETKESNIFGFLFEVYGSSY